MRWNKKICTQYITEMKSPLEQPVVPEEPGVVAANNLAGAADVIRVQPTRTMEGQTI